MLDKRVAAGELPPVEQRLPDQPVVVEPVKSIGKYGGTWRRLFKALGDMGLNSRLGYETLLRWDRSGTRVIPGIAESYTINDDATVFTFKLRKGMKWSDGHPFTSEDFRYTHDHEEMNEQLRAAHIEWKTIDDQVYEMETPDPYTVIFRFAKPYGLFAEMLCYRGSMRAICMPKHYMQQFHPAFRDLAQLKAEAKEMGFVNWRSYYGERSNLEGNPQLPTINAFVAETCPPAAQCKAVRNPFYWKVDPAGNQLPYIDAITYRNVAGGNVLNMKAQSGEVDFQTRHINASNFTLFMESRNEAGNPRNRYRVHVEPSTGAVCVYINQHSRDNELRPILQDERFRKALSHAINREEIDELVFGGLAQPSNGVTTDFDGYYTPGVDKTHTTYNPRLANRLLDEIGLKRGKDGMRRMPGGKPFKQLIHVYPSESGDSEDMWLLVCDYWREVGLHFIVKHQDGTLAGLQVRSGNSDFFAYASAGLHWELDGLWLAPIAPNSYYAPLYGRYYESKGKAGVKPPPQHQMLVDWYHEMKRLKFDQRLEVGQRVIKHWSQKCYLIGIVRKPEVFIISNRFKNVPDRIIQDYTLMAPGYIGIEQFYLDDSES